jgi:hypothetical protein
MGDCVIAVTMLWYERWARFQNKSTVSNREIGMEALWSEPSLQLSEVEPLCRGSGEDVVRSVFGPLTKHSQGMVWALG